MGSAPQDACPRSRGLFRLRIRLRDRSSDLSDSATTPKEAGRQTTETVPPSPWRLWQHGHAGTVPDGPCDDSIVEAIKRENLNALRDCIECSQYQVDPQAVAAAIVERLALAVGRREPRLAGRGEAPAQPWPSSGQMFEAG